MGEGEPQNENRLHGEYVKLQLLKVHLLHDFPS